MRGLLKRLGAWLDRRFEESERRKCQRRGHHWVQTGTFHPTPLIWFECRRAGCDVTANPVPARVTWHGPRSFTLTPILPGEQDWPEVIGG